MVNTNKGQNLLLDGRSTQTLNDSAGKCVIQTYWLWWRREYLKKHYVLEFFLWLQRRQFLYEWKVVLLLINEFFKKISCRAKIKTNVSFLLFVKSTAVIFIKTKLWSQHMQVKQTDLLPSKCFYYISKITPSQSKLTISWF